MVALVPMVDGMAAAVPRHGDAHAAASCSGPPGSASRSKIAAARGRGPVMMPIVARPGEVGAMTLPGALEDYLASPARPGATRSPPTSASSSAPASPGAAANRIGAPLLVQIADFDQSAPPQAAAKAAFTGQAEVRHYPCDHFDVFPGKPLHEPAVKHAVSFLTRHLAVEESTSPASPATL